MLNLTDSTERATSNGPLDASKSAGSELDRPDFNSNDNPQGIHSPQVEDAERQRNRLGYTVTEPTQEEMNEAPSDEDPLDDGENTQPEMLNRVPAGGGL